MRVKINVVKAPDEFEDKKYNYAAYFTFFIEELNEPILKDLIEQGEIDARWGVDYDILAGWCDNIEDIKKIVYIIVDRLNLDPIYEYIDWLEGLRNQEPIISRLDW
jgi:hypothetical protein